MKDCKWNPPTDNTKGMHIDSSGRMLERGDLSKLSSGDVLLKFIDGAGKPKTRRAVNRQIEKWRQDGTLEKMFSGVIDPPAGWVMYVRNDSVGFVGESAHGTERLTRPLVQALFEDAYEGGHYDDSPDYADEIDPKELALYTAATTALIRSGRISTEDAARVLDATQTFSQAVQNARNLREALKLTGSHTTAIELIVKHPRALHALSATDPLLERKLQLLRASKVSLNGEYPASLISPSLLLEQAAQHHSLESFAALTSRIDAVGKSAGSINLSPSLDQKDVLHLVSVLKDPLDQRALAIALAMASTYANGDPDALASVTPDLPEGANALDSLVRAVAAGVKDGRIHGSSYNAARLALDVISGQDPPRGVSVVTENWWENGSLGVLSTTELQKRTGADASIGQLVAKASQSASHWDTVVIPERPNEGDVLVAAALNYARRTGHDFDTEELDRLEALKQGPSSIREIARAIAQDPANADAHIAAAILSDSCEGRATPQAIALLGIYADSGLTGRSFENYALPVAAAAGAIASQAKQRLRNPNAPINPPEFEDHDAARIYAQMRAAAGASVGCIAEAFFEPKGLYKDPCVRVAFADTANVPALINLAMSATSALADVDEYTHDMIAPEITIRENEIVVSAKYATHLVAPIQAALAAEHANPDSSLLLAGQEAASEKAW